MMLMKDIGTVAISHSAIRCSHRERGIPFTHNEAAVTSGQLKQPPLDTLSTCFLKKHCHDKDKTYVCSVVSCCCACQYCWNQAIATTFSSSTIHPLDSQSGSCCGSCREQLVENNLSRTTCREQLVENNLSRTRSIAKEFVETRNKSQFLELPQRPHGEQRSGYNIQPYSATETTPLQKLTAHLSIRDSCGNDLTN